MEKRMTELNQDLLDEISLLIKNKKGKIIYIDGKIQLQNGKYLWKIMLNSDNQLMVHTSQGSTPLGIESLSNEDLEEVLKFIREIKSQKYKIKITSSRVFSVTSTSFSEAAEIAMKRLKKHPFDENDIDCCQSVII
jgi:hypothetical protein